MKDVVIEDLHSEKKVLQSELRSLTIILEKIRLTVASMSEKDRIAYTSALEGQEEYLYNKMKEVNCLEVCVLSSEEHSEVKENEANRFHILVHYILYSKLKTIINDDECFGCQMGNIFGGHMSIAK